jgi:hypothetical protein
MMETNSPLDNALALILSQPDANSLGQALDLCQGLQDISSKPQILMKFNLAFGDGSFPYEVLHPPGKGALFFCCHTQLPF